jgi:hypothetical protein
MVWMPEGSEFRSWYPSSVMAEIRIALERLSRAHGVPLVDAREWVSDDDFSDSHHLLSRGAAVFSERFEPEVLRLMKHTGNDQPPSPIY